MHRYAVVRPEIEKTALASLAHLDEHRRNLAVWSRTKIIDDALKLVSVRAVIPCLIDDQLLWNGGNVRPPMMMLGEASSLGVFGHEQGKPKVSFALNAKPFCADTWLYTQHLVASVTLYGGDNEHTFHPPYAPEWNEFFARRMHFEYNRLRIEPERIGIIIGATDHDTFLYGLPVPALVEQLFESVGLRAKLSSGGLIARQLISQLGGLQGARVFKIPDVRRLLKTYGPPGGGGQRMNLLNFLIRSVSRLTPIRAIPQLSCSAWADRPSRADHEICLALLHWRGLRQIETKMPSKINGRFCGFSVKSA